MFPVKPEIAVLSKQLFLVLLEADITATVENTVQQLFLVLIEADITATVENTVQEVKLLVSPPNELIPHPIIDVE